MELEQRRLVRTSLQGSGCDTVTADILEVPTSQGFYSEHVTRVSRGLYKAL